MADITYAHAGDISTARAHELEWQVGEVESRYQEVAIVNDKVIGSWIYAIEWRRGKAYIDSSKTDVTPRHQRRGVARAMWMRGITRWKPTSISATIATDQGRDFLARMHAWIAYAAPETRLWVKTRPEDAASWDSNCSYYAWQLLQKLGDQRAREQLVAAKQPKQLKAVP